MYTSRIQNFSLLVPDIVSKLGTFGQLEPRVKREDTLPLLLLMGVV